MTDPFDIEGPANVSFSGGRTSGYMLHRILERGIRPDVHVLFANTGKERAETLDFVHEVETRWDVPIRWLERHEDGSMVEVDYSTANRMGAPFRALIDERNFLPNPVMRFCTTELKIRIMQRFMDARGHETWTSVVGLRADEPGRVANQRAREASGKDPWSVAFPLFDAGVAKADVEAFWKSQPFDLRLRPWEGNCDLCFLKGKNRKLRVIRDNPQLAEWWIAREADLIGVGKPGYARFRHGAASYAEMAEMVRSQPLLPNIEDVPDDGPEDDSIDCFCTN